MTKLVMFSFLVLLIALPTPTYANIIQDTCKSASQSSPNLKYDFCVSSLQAAPNSGAASSAVDVGLIALGHLQRNVTATEGRVAELLKDPKQPRGAIAALKDCAELYDEATSTTEEATELYKAKNYSLANIKISGVFDDASTCHDGFDGQGLVSPLITNNDNAIQLSALVLAITKQLLA